MKRHPRRPPPATAAAPGRSGAIDALRGLALLWMTLFHFCFDLAHFGLARWDFYSDPMWTVQRSLIVGLFLLVAGMTQSLTGTRTAPAFWKRWTQIAAAALAVSFASWLIFPQSWISFGVLHGIALMLLLLRPLLRHAIAGYWWVTAGAVALVLPSLFTHPLFDNRWLNWVGLVTHKPITEDYLPLLPWIGIMAWGVALGRWLARAHPGLTASPLPPWLRPVAAIGRWSLAWYLLHQPVLFGLIAGFAALLAFL